MLQKHMNIYLDQNKWIELAQIYHGKNSDPKAIKLLEEIDKLVESGHCTFPLTAVHYMETARISNPGRKQRLGEVMWKYSAGKTAASYTAVIMHELSIALSKHFPQVKPKKLTLIGKGISHAYDKPFDQMFPPALEDEFERSILTGESLFGDEFSGFYGVENRKKFQNHLATLQRIKELPPNKWEDCIHAIVLADIVKPLAAIQQKFGISEDDFETLGSEGMTQVINDMPSRKLDAHLHRQVLRNPNYNAKISDLEDWAGPAVASQYFDVVVCEKHLADLIKRDKFQTKARVEKSIYKIFEGL